jgi:hypothetical protein
MKPKIKFVIMWKIFFAHVNNIRVFSDLFTTKNAPSNYSPTSETQITAM